MDLDTHVRNHQKENKEHGACSNASLTSGSGTYTTEESGSSSLLSFAMSTESNLLGAFSSQEFDDSGNALDDYYGTSLSSDGGSGSDDSYDSDSYDSSYSETDTSELDIDQFDVSDGSDWSQDDYKELLAMMPKEATKRAKAAAASGHSSRQSITVSKPIACPSEGLAMFQDIRKDLEQLGKMIVAKKDGAKFLERAHILASINWLSSNVPKCVLDHLGQEIEEILANNNTKLLRRGSMMTVESVAGTVEVMNNENSEASDLSEAYDDLFDPAAVPDALMPLSSDMDLDSGERRRGLQRFKSFESKDDPLLKASNLPALEYFQCSLMFVDISGFTKLSTLLDPENLSKVINSYFQQLVDKVSEFRGDIQKFAGDALFAEWRVTPTFPLDQCVEAAALCAASIVKECADFPVVAFGDTACEDSNSPITKLNVHCGLGVGEMAGVHVGDDDTRREYLYLGDPIIQATKACDEASLGEVVSSQRFFQLLDSSITNMTRFSCDKALLARGEKSIFSPDSVFHFQNAARNAKSRGITDYVDGLELTDLMQYRRLMSLYVHPVVVSKDVAAQKHVRSSISSSERHKEEAELRSVYVMFIKPLIAVDLKGKASSDREAVEQLNSVMNLVSRELKRYCGHLRQFIVDDKGLVLIATFGLKGSTFPNLVSERALPATVGIYNALQLELGVQSRVGATFGDTYCGAVGGEKRHEYAVMGPSVNLAARLMTSIDNPGILVDVAVRQLASRTYAFNALAPVVAKGYRDPVPIFEPLSPLERTWGRIEPCFVGRKEEIRQVVTMTREIARFPEASTRLVVVSGVSGIGKSALLVHLIEHSRKAIRSPKNFIVSKHVGKQGDVGVQFSTIRLLLRSVLAHYIGSDDELSISQSTLNTFLNRSQSSFGSLGSGTSAASIDLPESKITEVIADICDELDVGPELRRFALDLVCNISNDLGIDNRVTPDGAVSFLAEVYAICTRNAQISVLAVDGINLCDESSWNVIQCLFEGGSNLLIVGTCSVNSQTSLQVRPAFYKSLREQHSKTGRYVSIELGNLSKEDVIGMIMKKLGIFEQDVTPQLVNEVTVQSGGIPHFANEILEDIKSRSQKKCATEAKEVSDQVGEIILHRIDTLDMVLRNVLNVGAVIGNTFSLQDVVDVLKEGEDCDADVRNEVITALERAVNEGLLYIVGEEMTEPSKVHTFDDVTTFSFHHEAWHSTLLRLMLESRKRDVHRKVALSIEARIEDKETTLATEEKLFRHWKATGDTTKATTTALSIGEKFDEQGVTLYQETLKMWHWDEGMTTGIGGFSEQVFRFVGPNDLVNIISLINAMGNTYIKMNLHKAGVASFENCLRVLQQARNANQIKDRSIAFPAFFGLVRAVRDGHISQDSFLRYEQALIRRFLKETRSHGRLVHHIQGLSLQIDLYARLGEFEKAIAVQSVIKGLYKPERHSALLVKVYGRDTGALSFSLAANWRRIQGSNKQALKCCRYALKEIIPKVPKSLDNIFDLLYPLLLVFKSTGYIAEAEKFFHGVIVKQFSSYSCELFRVFEPITILHELASKERVAEMRMSYFKCWATDPENMCLGSELNMRLGRLGRCSDSISAEICLLLAERLDDNSWRGDIVQNGIFLAEQAVAFNKRNNFKAAQKLAFGIQTKLKAIRREL